MAGGTFTGQLSVDGFVSDGRGMDLFVGKWSSDGDLAWIRCYGGSDDDQLHGMAVDRSGNIYLTGYFAKEIDFGGGELVATARNTVFLAKLDPGGVLVWARAFGVDRYQSGYDVAVDSRGGRVAIAGEFVSTIDFGGSELRSAGSSDIFVGLFDENGTPIASRSFGDSSMQRALGLTFDDDGNLGLVGGFQGTMDLGGGDLHGGEGTFVEVFLAKFDSQLNHIWSGPGLAMRNHATHSHQEFESAHAVAVTGQAGLVVQAAFSEGLALGGQDFEAPNSSRGVLRAFDRAGGRIFERKLGQSGAQDEGSVTTDGEGNLWTAVSFLDSIDVDGDHPMLSRGGRDVGLFQFDPEGRVMQKTSFGEADRSEIAWSVAATSNSVVVGGWVRELGRAGSDEGLVIHYAR